MEYFLGVDVGNTKTLYALADRNGTVKNIYYGSPANFQALGIDESRKRVKKGIEKLLSNVNATLNDIRYAYYGIAGADRPRDFELIKKMLDNTGIKQFDFHNDGWIALKSGTVDGIGMVITCGTGNTNFACNSKGKWKRIGGLDILLGDALGASYIAYLTCRAAMRSKDGRGYPSLLTELVPKRLGVNEIEDVMELEYKGAHHSFDASKVVGALFEAAEAGDGVALEITWELVKEILIIVREFYYSLFQEEDRFKLVLEGSVFKARYQPFIGMIESALKQRYNVKMIIPEYDPVVGALFYAFERAGVRLTDELAERIINTYMERREKI